MPDPPHVVAFQGTPVRRGAGIRLPLLDDRECIWFGGTRVTRVELKAYVASGHITEVNPGIEAGLRDGVVLYRHDDFKAMDTRTDLTWVRCGDCLVTYLGVADAADLLRVWARDLHDQAAQCLQQDPDRAIVLVYQGLSVVPNLFTPNLHGTNNSPSEASMLWGLLCQLHGTGIR